MTVPFGVSVGKTRRFQKQGAMLALYHVLHTKGTDSSKHSVPTLSKMLTQQSLGKSCHFRLEVRRSALERWRRWWSMVLVGHWLGFVFLVIFVSLSECVDGLMGLDYLSSTFTCQNGIQIRRRITG